MATRRAAARNKAKDLSKEAKLLLESKEKIREEVAGWFRKYDRDANAVLDRDELKSLLEGLAGTAPSEKVVNVAWASAKPTKVGGTTVQGISKDAASEVVSKVLEYIKQQSTIDPIFEKFDTDGNGVLDEEELLALLQSVATHHNMPPESVTKEDVATVLRLADANGTNVIERDEVLFACARWRNLVIGRPKPPAPPEVDVKLRSGSSGAPKEKSAVCAIL